MDISSTSAVSASRQAVQDEYATRVLKKALDANRDQGEQLAKLVDQQTGLGQQMDVYA